MRQIPVSFRIFPPIPEKLSTRPEASDDHQNSDITLNDPQDIDNLAIPKSYCVRDAPFDTPPTTETNELPEHNFNTTPASTSHLPPKLDDSSPTSSKTLGQDCPICCGFDARPHGDGVHLPNITNLSAATHGGNGNPGLPISLLWETNTQDADDNQSSSPRPGLAPSGRRAPSWSRSSVTCPVQYAEIVGHVGSYDNHSKETDCVVTCEVLDAICGLALPDLWSPVESGRSTITVKGLMSEVKCRVDPGSNGKEMVRDALDVSGADWSVRLAQDVLPPRSIAKKWDKVEETFVFLPVVHYGGQWSEETPVLTMEGLALRRMAGVTDCYTRVGAMRLRFWANEGRSLTREDLLMCATEGMAEKIATII